MAKLRIAINGFGRIGRVFFRAALQDREFWDLCEIVAVNDLGTPENLAYLLKYDSTYGRLDVDIRVKDNKIIVDDLEILALREPDPAKLPWKDLEVDAVLESTGVFTYREGAAKHLEAGAKKVVISAPAKNPDITLVIGVNDDKYDPEKHHIISMASCTTNALAVTCRVLQEEFGIKRGMFVTVHAVTLDQRLLDAIHKKDFRRGRAALNAIVPTTTGAQKALGEVIPELKGKMWGLAMRVPTMTGSVIYLVAELEREVTRDEVNSAFKKWSEGKLEGILGYTEDPIVSHDIVGVRETAVIDGASTAVLGEKSDMIHVVSWYDNEFGFCCRLVDLFKLIARKSA